MDRSVNFGDPAGSGLAIHPSPESSGEGSVFGGGCSRQHWGGQEVSNVGVGCCRPGDDWRSCFLFPAKSRSDILHGSVFGTERLFERALRPFAAILGGDQPAF